MNDASHTRRQIAPSASTGFTLVELLAVIAIIGILTALTFATVGKIRASARSTQCQSNLRQIGVASLLYSADNKGTVLPVYYPNEKTSDPLDLRHWPGLLARYMGRVNLTDPLTSYTEMPVFDCSELPDVFGYGHNYNWLSPYSPQPSTNITVQLIKQTDIATPSKTVLIADMNVPASGAWRPFVRPASWNGWKIDAANSVAFRHSGDTCNVVWVDGHVSAEHPDSTFTNNDSLWDRQ